MNERIMNAINAVEDNYQNFGEVISLERQVCEERCDIGTVFE